MFDREDAARHQLHDAIDLFFVGRLYSALTLAGAASEVLGQMNRAEGHQSSYEIRRDAVAQMYERLFGPWPNRKKNGDPIVPRINEARNALKHYDPAKDSQCVDLDLEDETKDALNRAIDDYYHLYCELTPSMKRFQDHTVDSNNAQLREPKEALG